MLEYNNKKFYFFGNNVKVGKGAIIEPLAILGIEDRFHPPSKLIIGQNALTGSRCTIYSGVTAGDNHDVSDQTTIFTDNKIGNHVRIGPKTVIKNGCEIGDYVRINSQVFLERVIIENNVFIGPNTTFTDDLHPPCPKYKECIQKSYVESFVSIGGRIFNVFASVETEMHIRHCLLTSSAPFRPTGSRRSPTHMHNQSVSPTRWS